MYFKWLLFDRLKEWSILGAITTLFPAVPSQCTLCTGLDSIFLVEVGYLLSFLHLLALAYLTWLPRLITGIIFHSHFVMILYS